MRISFYCRANYLNEKNPNEVYTPADTIHQYLEHFVTFRKTGLTSQQQQCPYAITVCDIQYNQLDPYSSNCDVVGPVCETLCE